MPINGIAGLTPSLISGVYHMRFTLPLIALAAIAAPVVAAPLDAEEIVTVRVA